METGSQILAKNRLVLVMAPRNTVRMTGHFYTSEIQLKQHYNPVFKPTD